LRARGPVFSSGHDLKELASWRDRPDRRRLYSTLFASCSALMGSLRRLRQPVLAQVSGVAAAAGCQLVATCDLALATRASLFQTPGVRVGLFCSTPGVALLRGVSGHKAALQMLLTGEAVTATEAKELGLVNGVCKDDAELEEEVLKLAAKIVRYPLEVTALGKRAFYEQADLPVEEAYAVAERYMVENLMMEDSREGISAFSEKRKPNWHSSESK